MRKPPPVEHAERPTPPPRAPKGAKRQDLGDDLACLAGFGSLREMSSGLINRAARLAEMRQGAES